MDPNSSVDSIPKQVENFPMKAILKAALVENIHTDVVVMEFSNRLFVLVTQFGKIGNLIQVIKDSAQSESEAISVFHTECLLGKDNIEHHLIGRMIAERINVNKPLLLGLALQNNNKSTIQNIVHFVCQVYLQGH